MRVDPRAWNALDLRVHDVLKDVPLQDVSMVELPGGGEGRTLEDLRRLLPSEGSGGGGATAFLFWLRGLLGRLFGWDRELTPGEKKVTFAERIPADLRERSVRPPGTKDGIFELLYQLDREMLSEVRNRTVHAFSCMALVPYESGYRFYWGIYVLPISRFTRYYMAAIEPFRRFIVYPQMLAKLEAAWQEEFAPWDRSKE